MSVSKKLIGVLKPNALIGRTVWSSPQRGECCNLCKYFVHGNPSAEYDPGDQKSWRPFVSGRCGNLRVLAAYGDKTPHCRTYFTCNKFEEKEKENGS
jgi:hypothetical protein